MGSGPGKLPGKKFFEKSWNKPKNGPQLIDKKEVICSQSVWNKRGTRLEQAQISRVYRIWSGRYADVERALRFWILHCTLTQVISKLSPHFARI
jgi:hypothetical protein